MVGKLLLSITSWTGVDIWSKTILVILATPFRKYALFPACLQFFKCILEVVFCAGVQHHLQSCLYHLNCIKKAGNRAKAQGTKSDEQDMWGTTFMLFLVKKFPCEKGSVRWCTVVMQEPVLL
jgi:hypothetical protein